MAEIVCSHPYCKPAVSRRECRLAFGFAVAVMIVATLPYLAGYAAQVKEWQFTGFIYYVFAVGVSP